jgi:hypothetical protein
VKVERYGSAAGVQDKALGVGTYWTGIGTDICEYPIYTSNYAWTKAAGSEDAANGDETKGNESSAFRIARASSSPPMSQCLSRGPGEGTCAVPKYRTDMPGIVAGPLRNAVRSALVDQASTMSVEDIYGAGKTKLINGARQVCGTISSRSASMSSSSTGLARSASRSRSSTRSTRTKNEQQALAAQANVATIKANADAAIAEANGEAEATKVKAVAEAEAIRIRAQALANNPRIVGYEWVQKWDGEMPHRLLLRIAALRANRPVTPP